MADHDVQAEPAAAATAAVTKGGKKPRAPNEKEHTEKMDALSKQIADLEAEMATLKTAKGDEEAEKPKVKTPVQLKRDALFSDLKPIKAEKEALMASRKQLGEEVEKLNGAITKLTESQQAKGETRLKTAEEIDQQISALKTKLESGHHKLIEEKKIVADIDNLKRSKKTLAEQAEARVSVKDSRDKIRTLRDQMTELTGKIQALRTKEDAIKTELSSLKEAGQSEFAKRNERRKEIKEKLDELYNTRREANKTFREEKNAYFEATKEEREAARQKRAEEKRAYEEAKKAADEARQKAWDEYEASRHPWEDQMKTCDLLIEYLSHLGPAGETSTETETAAKVIEAPEGTVLHNKKDREEEYFMGGGGGKKVKKAKKAAGPSKPKTLKHAPAVFQQFMSIGLQPPSLSTDVPDMLQTLVNTKADYETKPRPEKKSKKVAAAEPASVLDSEEPAAEQTELPTEPAGEQTPGGDATEATAEAEAAATKVSASEDPVAAAVPDVDEGEIKIPPMGYAKPPPHFTVYDDDSAIGKTLPDLSSLVYVKGAPVAIGQGSPAMILFWAKFAEGDYSTIVAVSALHRAYQIPTLGISVDLDQASVEKFVTKIGSSMPEINIPKLIANFPLAFDSGKKVKVAMQTKCNLLSLGASAVFLVDGQGTIVWREQFSQGHTADKGQLPEQVRRLVAGEPLLSNGLRPKAEEKEDDDLDDGDCVMGDPDDDGLLF